MNEEQTSIDLLHYANYVLAVAPVVIDRIEELEEMIKQLEYDEGSEE